MGAGRTKNAEDIKEKQEKKSAEPPKYHVLMLNDDYTTMDFVIHVLQKVFHKSTVEATQIMLHVHHRGKGLAGTYPREIAETKIDAVHKMAKASGFPLRCVMDKS